MRDKRRAGEKEGKCPIASFFGIEYSASSL